MIVALAGGVGAAKLLLGLTQVVRPEQVAIICNTGDDIELFGLRICPDLDTVTYTLSGVVNPETGWGLKGDTFQCLDNLGNYGGETWFRLGDRDLATHLWRTHLLHQGFTLMQVTERMRSAFGVRSQLIPMTNEYTPTRILIDGGELHLQEYLVREQCRPRVRGLKYSHMEQARPTSGIEQLILTAEAVLICPSNPFISIGPILAVPGIMGFLHRTPAPVVAVSPIICGRALKGPAANMLQQLGHAVSARGVAEIYRNLVDVFVLDEQDANLAEEIEDLGMRVGVMDTVMNTTEEKVKLARRILELT
ncbi:MAG: 2-phospho-L-lactate transferase [Acidobacteria bacterium]|nr:2-phospho-L-lactate transferase [Acidobacteriota bacterium]